MLPGAFGAPPNSIQCSASKNEEMKQWRMFLRLHIRRILVLLFSLNAIFFLYLYLAFTGRYPPEEILNHPYFYYDLDVKEPKEVGQKCVLPRIHPFDPSVWAYLKFQKNVSCKKRQSDLIYIDHQGRISWNKTELETTGYEVGRNLFCQWSAVLSPNDDTVSYAQEVEIPKEGYQLTSNVSIVRIRCNNYAGYKIYEKVQAHVHVPDHIRHGPYSVRHPINVLIFGLDSLSRLSFIRHLPRTYRYLTEELNMTILRGMNKVGDNTFPNLIPILTGHKAYGDGLGSVTDYFDDWPLIWKNFSDAGYGTFWAEDFIKYGLFNYLAKGFRKPPTDHYMRPYWLAIEGSETLRHSSYMCYGSSPKYFGQLDFLQRFLLAYSKANKPFFGFSFLVEITHEYTTRIASADAYLEQFFVWLKNNSYLDNTFLIVMSDHGHRFDSIRKTQVGHIEERMPFYAVYIPHTIKSLQPHAQDILLRNSGRLVTPFDIYATLSDVLNLATSGRPLGKADPSSERLGQTLFREIPLNRTCSDASIPIQYCICETDTAIPVTDVRAQRAAAATVSAINKLVEDGNMSLVCQARTLSSIKTAHLVHTVEDSKETAIKVRVMLETEPEGVFEALVLFDSDVPKVIGEISRLDQYGNQSFCIQHQILRKFCYCNIRSKKAVETLSTL